MKPSEVRAQVLREHTHLRGLLTELEILVRRAQRQDEQAIIELPKRARALHDFFCSHLDLEDHILLPALRQADCWGDQRVEQLELEHRAQRERMAALLEQIEEDEQPPRTLARSLADLIGRLLNDMAQEEDDALSECVLCDDVVALDASDA